MTKSNPTQAGKQEKKGDSFAQQGQHDKALKHYRESQKLHPNNPAIYGKLIEAHQKTTAAWTDNDFSETLEWTMKQQELNNPKLKRVHAKLDPSFKETIDLITRLLMSQDQDLENHLVQKIIDSGEKALYPLIETVLSFKKLKKPT